MSERCQQPQAHPARCGCEQLTPKGYGEYAGRLVHPDKYAALQAECERYKSAFNVWHDKTEWVQKTATAQELGEHRADVLRERIEVLEAVCERLRADLNASNERYDREVLGLNNEGDPVGGEPAYGLLRQVERLRSELAAIKAQEPVGYFVETGGEWEQVNAQFKDDSDVVALYMIPTVNK